MNQKFHSVYYCAIVVSFGAFILGLDAALISGTIKFVSAEFGLSDMHIGVMVSAPVFLLTNLGASSMFLFYGVCGFIGFFLMYKIMPETKNKSIEEIELMLNKSAA